MLFKKKSCFNLVLILFFLRNLILKLQNYMWNLCDILFCESKSLTNYLNKFNGNFKIITLYNPIRDESSLNYSKNKELKNLIIIKILKLKGK